jgi:UDP:flavonoid glycosyltransferase YjiC (YdhE family)
MNIGIYTYGTRGDVQPYIALALGLIANGHNATLAAPENFKGFVEGFGIPFHPLYGNAEEIMNSPEGQQVLATENTIKLMKFFFKVLHSIRVPLRESYVDSISKVDFIIANSATLNIVGAIAEKQHKKMALTYFMPPVVPTTEFPLSDFDFFNFKWYNKFTYKLAHTLYWKFVKAEVNEFRTELGLPVFTKNMLVELEKQHLLDLYCISPTLIPQPKDWTANHKITGFLTIPSGKRELGTTDQVPVALNAWLDEGSKPIYMGFGSNGVGNSQKFAAILQEILDKTNERILFCTGWAMYDSLPMHKNLFITKYANHEVVLPKCKTGIFHGGAGTLAAMLRNNLPVIIISFYTDQPAWGKIIESKVAGVHIPLKKLTAAKLIKAIEVCQTAGVKQNAANLGASIRAENGLGNAVHEIEGYFRNS